MDTRNIKNRIERLVEYNKNGDPSVLEVANSKVGNDSLGADKQYQSEKTQKNPTTKSNLKKSNTAEAKAFIDKIKKEVEDKKLEEDYDKELKVGPQFM